jgi:4-carboxymuconolactone decarboxylase
MPTLEEYRAAGQALRRRVFGAPAATAKSATQELAPDLVRISDEVLFGQVWSRSGLELPHRSMITIAALTALGREPELKAHIRGGLNLGLSREQIVEIIFQLAFYAGQPAAHAAFRAAKEVFDQLDAATR